MKRLMIPVALATIFASLFASCGGGANATQSAADSSEAQQVDSVPAIDLAAMDTAAKPQDNFYLYCNGGWMKANPLPADKSRYGSFDILRDSSQARINRIINDLANKQWEKGSDEYKIATLYNQAMDTTQRNQLGAKPMEADLKEITNIKDKKELVNLLAKMGNEGGTPFFSTFVYADAKNSNANILNLNQASLALGNRDYYTDPKQSNILKEYTAYINKILLLAGYSKEDAKRIADNNLEIEKQIANMCYTNLQLRDSYLNYNKLKVSDFIAKHPGFDFATYMKLRHMDKVDSMNVGQTGYFEKFAKWYAATDLNKLKDYMIAQEIDGAASILSQDFARAHFDFYSKEMAGTKEMQPLWKRATDVVDGALGMPLGKIYVKKYFPQSSKQKMITLVKNLQAALKERIQSLTWMSEATKAKAIDKLSHYDVKIGYPDKWEDYSKMEILADNNYYQNMKNIAKFEVEKNFSELGKPVDKSKWGMTPQTVNAYYNPQTNEICFPAAILQPPFFNPTADDAVNYGAIGVVIGHEMTHGFDDQGRNFDANGNMVDWWTRDDAKKFQESAQKLAAEYSAVEVAQGVHANGKMTLGENIADQGGLVISHLALQKLLAGKKVAPIDGFTPEQRFYIAYARLWGQNIREQEILRLTKLDVHSLGVNRVNVALKNITPFIEAFNVKEGDPMWLAPDKRVLVW